MTVHLAGSIKARHYSWDVGILLTFLVYNSKSTTVEIEFLRDSDQDAPGCTDSLHAVIMTRWPVAHEVPAC